MQDPRDPDASGLRRIVRINISVIILNAETKHPHIATLISFSKRRIPEKLLYGIFGLFDMKTGFFICRIHTHPAVTGTDKMSRFHINMAGTLPDLPLEKIIVRDVFTLFIITHIQMIEPYKGFHRCCRKPGIQKLSHGNGNNRSDQWTYQHASGYRTVDFFQKVVLKGILLCNMPHSVRCPDHRLPPLSMESL